MNQLAMTEPDNEITDEERSQLEEEFRSQLEVEHSERQLAQQRRASKHQDRSDQRDRERQLAAEAEIKEGVRSEFFKEKGYKRYTDSAGRQHWLTPEEYEWRMRARAQRDRRRKSFESNFWARRRLFIMYAGAALLAVLLGLFLIR